MQNVIRSIFVLFLLGFFTVASAQLPPKIIADKHLIHAEQLYAAKDYAEAFKVMEKIIALQKEYSLTLPDEFHFKYAQVALAADSTRIALEAVTRYLSATEDEGEFYKEALALMLKAEGDEVMTAEDFYNDVIKTEGTCEGLPAGSSCWMALTNHSECYVWNDKLWEGETAIWTGQCLGHLPDGKGTLIWYITRMTGEGEDRKKIKRKSQEITGSFQKGKWHGEWARRKFEWVSGSGEYVWSVQSEDKGSYVNGKLHGQWSTRYWDGSVRREGSYVDGKRQGQWVVYDTWRLVHNIYRSGPAEGSYVDDKRQGQWVVRYSDGTVYGEGSYVDDKKHGQWVTRHRDGTTKETTYVDGKAHGQVIRFSDGMVGGGSYDADGKEHGEWIEGYKAQEKSKGRYVNGKKEGTWLEYDNESEICWSLAYDNGKYRSSKSKTINKEKCREAGLIP